MNNHIMQNPIPLGHDVVIQDGVQRNGRKASVPGVHAYKERVKNSRAGYNASMNKKLFVFDNVIVPLLNEGRRFYVKRGNLYELIDLTDDQSKREITTRVINDMRDSNKRLRASTQH